MSYIETAREYRKKAKAAASNIKNTKASGFYFKAAKYYGYADEKYWQKYCQGKGWYCKALGINEVSIDDSLESAENFDKAVRAYNATLQYPKADATDEGNMRFAEGNKYTSLANAEVERARQESGQVKAEHLRRAAEYKLSGAQAKKQAAELSKKQNNMPNYYNRLGSYHDDHSTYHYHRAWAEKEIENWEEALEEYESSKEEIETAIELYRKSLAMESTNARKSNLKKAEAWLKNIIGQIANVRPRAERVRRGKPVPSGHGAPNLNVRVKEMEGMLKDLVSTISVALENSGDGEARNIDVSLKSSFLEGDTEADVERLGPGRSTSVGLSVVPMRAGSPTAKLLIHYEDINGKSYSQRARATLTVASPQQKRPAPQQIFNIQGDYAGEKHAASYRTESRGAAVEFAQAEMEKEHSRVDAKVMTGGGGVGSNMAMMKQEFDKLKQIREMGVITEEEFEVRRKGLLERYGV